MVAAGAECKALGTKNLIPRTVLYCTVPSTWCQAHRVPQVWHNKVWHTAGHIATSQLQGSYCMSILDQPQRSLTRFWLATVLVAMHNADDTWTSQRTSLNLLTTKTTMCPTRIALLYCTVFFRRWWLKQKLETTTVLYCIALYSLLYCSVLPARATNQQPNVGGQVAHATHWPRPVKYWSTVL